MTDMLVELRDLRRALVATKPHIPQPKDDPRLARVRFTPQPHTLEVTATDRYTMALALVSVGEYAGDALDPFDLTADDVAKVLAVFPASAEEVLIRIATSSKEVVFTDVSGLLAGEPLTLQLTTSGADDLFPDVRAAFAGRLRQGHALEGEWWLNPRLMHRFEAATSTYGAPWIVEPTRTGKALVIRVGESFLGTIALTRPNQDAELEAAAHARAWDDRLPLPADVAHITVLTSPTYYADAPPESDEEVAERAERKEREQLAQAAELVITTQFGSSSMLQRKMRVPFAVGKKLLEDLAARGIVAAADGSKARAVLTPVDRLPEVLAEIRGTSA